MTILATYNATNFKFEIGRNHTNHDWIYISVLARALDDITAVGMMHKILINPINPLEPTSNVLKDLVTNERSPFKNSGDYEKEKSALEQDIAGIEALKSNITLTYKVVPPKTNQRLTPPLDKISENIFTDLPSALSKALALVTQQK